MKKNILLVLTHLLFLCIGGYIVKSFLPGTIPDSNTYEEFTIPTISIRVCNATDTMINVGLVGTDAPNFPEVGAEQCSEYKESYELFANQPLSIDTLENRVWNRYLYTAIDTMEARNVVPGKYTLTIQELTDGSIIIEHQDAIKYKVLRDGDFKSVYDF